MEEASDVDGEGTVVLTSSLEFDPVENMVAIPIPPPVITLIPIEVPEVFIPPSVRTTPSPPYVASREEDPESSGVPEFWADPEAGQSWILQFPLLVVFVPGNCCVYMMFCGFLQSDFEYRVNLVREGRKLKAKNMARGDYS
jgi:hypothetical protein